MPRPPRLVVPNYPHHVILRGNNRSAIFNKDEDRRFFIMCLKEAKEKTGSKIYSYCLMTNHVHFIIVPLKEDALGDMMQSLGRKYVQYINRNYNRTGTLWEGRFKSGLISNDSYLLVCSVYIESNPVRSKMVKNPGDYPWSSYCRKAEGENNLIVDIDPLYEDLGKTDRERQSNYRKWFTRELSPDNMKLIRHATQKGGIIGNESFINMITKMVGRRVALRSRGRPKKSL